MKWKEFLELFNNINPEEEVACIIWTRPDVYDKANEDHPDITITDEIADEVLYRMDGDANCENGITWDSLEYHLDAVLQEQNLI